MHANIFGTDGIRTHVGKEPFTLESLPRLGYAIGSWIISTYGIHARILVGRDTRASGDWMFAALSTGLLVHPLSVVYAGVLSTPALGRLLYRSATYDVGIVISASHNSYYDNGIKIMARAGHKVTTTDEIAISQNFYATHQIMVSPQGGSLIHWTRAVREYSDDIAAQFPSRILHGLKIVLDCAHGATAVFATRIFKTLGAKVITIHAQPNGLNINHRCGALHVESLQQAVREHRADLGFAFDGDGDRVITVTNNGTIKNGDDLVALLSLHPLYRTQSTVVGTVMSNLGLDHYLHHHQKKLIRTAVGDKYITEALITHHLLLGGEQSGHIILHDYLPTGDGIFAALRLCETIIATNNWDLETFTHYPQLLINVPVTIKKDLTDPSITAIIKEYESQLPSGRLLVRYSGTENTLRIMIEDPNHATITLLGHQLAHTLEKYLQ
jgi:phosphoglucosamine mutase